MSTERSTMPASRRIAFGTVARATGEAVGKLSSLAFLVVIARELGQERFGDFVFAMSLSTVLMLGAGLGMQELLGREVAKDPRRGDSLLADIVALKGLMMAALLVVIAAVVAAQGRPLDRAAAIVVVGAGIGLEYQAGTLYAVFDGRERQQYVAATLVVNRVSTALMAGGAAIAGAGLLTVAALFTAGSALGLLTAYVLMRRFVLRPPMRIRPRSWGRLIRASLPLGVRTLLGTLSFRASVILLGLIAAGSAEVGEYGAAYRLLEATMFIPAAFNSAVLAWFSRHDGRGAVPLSRGYELALKSVLALALPIGLGLSLFAEPVIETLYGSRYAGAVTPLRWLGALAVLWAINTTVATILVTRNRPEAYTMPALVGLVPNILLSAILIPDHGADGAAVAAVAAAAVLVGLLAPRSARLFGAVAPLRTFAAPLGAGAVMAGAALALSALPWVLTAAVALAAYAAAFLAIERLLEPADFAFYAAIVRRAS